MATAVAHFASRRASLLVIERTATPQYEGGRLVKTLPGKYHQFADHHAQIEGQKSIDFMRDRIKAADAPEMWEVDASDVPQTTDLLAELATADVARVREILAAEKAGPNREQVVGTCEAVLSKMNAAERGPGSVKANPRHEV
jgi:hypothetical protein